MTVLVLGVGLQGRATVYDLARCGLDVVAADRDLDEARRSMGTLSPGIVLRSVDATDHDDLCEAIRVTGARVVVCMVPPALQQGVARAAVEQGVSFVSSCYTRQLGALDEAARSAGVALLPEMGVDPGIDLVLCRLAVESLDEVHGLRSYGGGVPERSVADNLLRYKVSWTLSGVLSAYRRPARLLRAGEVEDIAPEALFDDPHQIEVDDVGTMEAVPNGDALVYLPRLGLGDGIRDTGRYTLRWPGHAAAWRLLGGLGLLDLEPVVVDGVPVSPRTFLAHLLEPQLQYGPDEGDLVVLRSVAWGRRQGRATEVCWDLVDRRDPATGLFAMNRTVGFTASIAAQMILDGTIDEVGLLSPTRDVPVEALLDALRERGMGIVNRTLSSDDR